MNKQVDIRCYVSVDFKKKIKQIALDKNTSVNKLLNDILQREFGEPNTEKELQEELDVILSKLSNSGSLSKNEREQLKQRKNELKSILKK
jgi:hypothetical protein